MEKLAKANEISQNMTSCYSAFKRTASFFQKN